MSNGVEFDDHGRRSAYKRLSNRHLDLLADDIDELSVFGERGPDVDAVD